MFEQFVNQTLREITDGKDLTGKVATAALTVLGLLALALGRKALCYAGRKTWGGVKALSGGSWFETGPVAKEILAALDSGEIACGPPYRMVAHDEFTIFLDGVTGKDYSLTGFSVWQESENITAELTKRDRKKIRRKAWAVAAEIEKVEKAALAQARARRIRLSGKDCVGEEKGNFVNWEKDCDDSMARAISEQDLSDKDCCPQEPRREDPPTLNRLRDGQCRGADKPVGENYKDDLTQEEVHRLLEAAVNARRKNGKA